MTHVQRPYVCSCRGRIYPRHHSSSPAMLKNNMTINRTATPQLCFKGSPMKSVKSAVSKLTPGFSQGGKNTGGAIPGMEVINSKAVLESAPMLTKVTRHPPIAHSQSFPVIGSRRKRSLISLQDS